MPHEWSSRAKLVKLYFRSFLNYRMLHEARTIGIVQYRRTVSRTQLRGL